MRIGVLTGGGDVPGLNPCIKTIVYNAVDQGHEAFGIRRGWAGLLEYNPDLSLEEQPDKVMPLDKAFVRTIDRTGGTILHTSRTNPSRVKSPPDFLKDTEAPTDEEGRRDYTAHVLRVLDNLGIDVLIPIGGDDTLSYALRLYKEGFPVVAVPKTMDNDVYGTDYCIGFSTAVSRSVEFITALRTPTGSHERIAVIELFGRYSGETCLISAYLADVDRAIIAEVPFDVQKLANFLLEDAAHNPSNYAVMTISEGAQMIEGEMVERGEADAFGHRKLGGVGLITGELIKKLTGRNIIYQQLAYLMRSGAPDSLDRMVAVSYGHLATDLALKGEKGLMVALHEGKYTTMPLETVTAGKRRVNVNEYYDVENYRPKVRSILGKPMFMH